MGVGPTGAGYKAAGGEGDAAELDPACFEADGGERGWGPAEVGLHAGCAPCFTARSSAKVWAPWL